MKRFDSVRIRLEHYGQFEAWLLHGRRPVTVVGLSPKTRLVTVTMDVWGERWECRVSPGHVCGLPPLPRRARSGVTDKVLALLGDGAATFPELLERLPGVLGGEVAGALSHLGRAKIGRAGTKRLRGPGGRAREYTIWTLR